MVISDTLVRYSKVNWSCQGRGRGKISHYWVRKRSIRLCKTDLIRFRPMLHRLWPGIWRRSKGTKSLSRNTLRQYYGSQIIQQRTTSRSCEICSLRYQLSEISFNQCSLELSLTSDFLASLSIPIGDSHTSNSQILYDLTSLICVDAFSRKLRQLSLQTEDVSTMDIP